MTTHPLVGAVITILFLAGCATGKTVSDAKDIRDSGKSNIVVFTYDLKLYTTIKYPTVENTKLNFSCPEKSALSGANCFSVSLPYLGRKEVDGFSLHAFELSGAKVMNMKYGTRSVSGAFHSVLVDKVSSVSCFYNKKTKKDVCNPIIKDEKNNHRVTFTESIPITVAPGSGCNLGHLTLTMVDGTLTEFNAQLGEATLAPEKLTNLSDSVSSTVRAYVDRACS